MNLAFRERQKFKEKYIFLVIQSVKSYDMRKSKSK